MSNLSAYLVHDATATDGPDFDALVAARELSVEYDLEHYGHTDLVPSQDAFNAGLVDKTYYFKRQYVIKRDGEIVGSASFSGGLKDNTHLQYVDVYANASDPEVLAFGYDLADQVAQEENRTTLNAYLAHPVEPEADNPNYLASPTGIGAVDTSEPYVRALLDSSWTLEQTERYSMLRLPVPDEIVKPLEEKARAKASDAYELVQWISHTPDKYLDGHARLHQAMSTDVPSAGLEIEETSYDGERIRYYEGQIKARGKEYLAIAAVHKESGELAGFTRVEFSEDKPESVVQEETLVLNEHRGHNLGLWLKSVLVQELVKLRPQAARIHTWNAGENSYMLNINVALGFTKQGIEGAWQKKLS